MKTLTDFEKIAGYLTVLEEQQAIVTDMINEMAEAKNDAFDAILEAKASLNLATEALKKQLAELDHIEMQKTHMAQVLAELDAVKRSAINSLDMTALQFRELAKTVPNELGQNVMAIIQHTDIAGAVRQRTDAQMDAIATQVEILAARSRGFVKDIQSAQDDLKKRYGQLQHYFWWFVGGGLLAMGLVTALSAQLFFGQELDRNYSAVVATYQKVAQLEAQVKALENK